MPNWCSNDLWIKGPPAEVLAAIKGDEGEAIDFEKIDPMPESLHVDSPSDLAVLCARGGDLGPWAGYEWVREAGITTPEGLCRHMGRDFGKMAEVGTQVLRNIEEHGHPTWYEWSREHWGTKWNACETKLEYEKPRGAKITFDTAWAPPEPVVKKLSGRFPEHTFVLKFYEGGMGYKGSRKYRAGRIVESSDGRYAGRRGG